MPVSIKDFKPMSTLSDGSGAKILLYGPPGSGKTPSLCTAPRPLILLTEAGALSVRGASSIPGYPAFNPKAIKEFFDWFNSSAEVRHFDTICVDSVTKMADIIVTEKLGGKSKAGNKPDGKAMYGEMAKEVMEYMHALHYRPGINVICVAHQGVFKEMGTDFTKPVFPGKALNVEVPHLFDEVLHIGVHSECGVTDKSTLQCRPSFDILARDRSDTLSQFEFTDMSALIHKIKHGPQLSQQAPA